jgi:hypothetical protein
VNAFWHSFPDGVLGKESAAGKKKMSCILLVNLIMKNILKNACMNFEDIK